MLDSKSCESSGDVGKILCLPGPSKDKKKFRDVGHEVVSIFQIFSLNQNLSGASTYQQNLTFLLVFQY